MADSYIQELKVHADRAADGNAEEVLGVVQATTEPRIVKAALRGLSNGAFMAGLIEGVRMFAVYKDGEQFCGALRRPLKEVIADIHQAFGYEEKAAGGPDR